MQIKQAASLAALLAVFGCDKPAEPPPRAAAAVPEKVQAVEIPPEAQAATVTPPPEKVEAFAKTMPDKVEIKVGMSREEVINLAGLCLQRSSYIPGYKKRLMVETLQPRDGECQTRLGKNRVQLVGGVVTELMPGLDDLSSPPQPSSRKNL